MQPDPTIEALKERVAALEVQMREHYHNGESGQEIQLARIRGLFRTITTAGALTIVLASKPRRVIDQVLIDTSTATKKLYVFDTIGAVWRSCTIS